LNALFTFKDEASLGRQLPCIHRIIEKKLTGVNHSSLPCDKWQFPMAGANPLL
jgi:hypothetical protein